MKAWCRGNYLSQQALKEVEEIRRQLVRSFDERDLQLNNTASEAPDYHAVLIESLARGLHLHVPVLEADSRPSYKTVLRNQYGLVHLESVLAEPYHRWIVYSDFTPFKQAVSQLCHCD